MDYLNGLLNLPLELSQGEKEAATKVLETMGKKVVIKDRIKLLHKNLPIEHLNQEERESLLEILEKFNSILQLPEDAPGMRDHLEREIPLKPGTIPINVRLHRLPQSKEGGVRPSNHRDVAKRSGPTNLRVHNKRLLEVLQWLKEANIRLQPDKCNFLGKEVVYLGHIITADGIRADPSKIEAVSSFPEPENEKEVISFLSLAGYYRKFMNDISKMATPLTELLK
ncbi:uncharacterized protein LOC107043682 [Diachasma alloeum]|uniref:uncharacterized protein LOC107043682 n=1 Tax=Diachasma alloeum TaxID=454923 RepID=UPI00073837DE|nr:uncharacterized protein LOC107043682 [Diachasma alloeum]